MGKGCIAAHTGHNHLEGTLGLSGTGAFSEQHTPQETGSPNDKLNF